MSARVTRWWWIRHAPVSHLADYIYGDSDPEADVSEHALFERVSARLPDPAMWIVTNLQRTQQTAQAIGRAGFPVPEEFTVEPDLREQGFGEWHGKAHSDHNRERTDPFVGVWNCAPDERPPGGESFKDLMSRSRAAIERLTMHVDPGDIVCVAHGGTIRSALALALGLTPAAALAFGSDNVWLTRIEYEHDAPEGGLRWRVREVNG